MVHSRKCLGKKEDWLKEILVNFMGNFYKNGEIEDLKTHGLPSSYWKSETVKNKEKKVLMLKEHN